MRKKYTKPFMVCEAFTPNEYCSTCGEQNTVYNFKCDAGNKETDYNVYLADGTPYATSGRDSGGCKIDYYNYSPCGETHEANTNSGFLPGYMYKQGRFGSDTGDKIDVIIWTENYTNVHCTTNLEMDSWETTKS